MLDASTFLLKELVKDFFLTYGQRTILIDLARCLNEFCLARFIDLYRARVSAGTFCYRARARVCGFDFAGYFFFIVAVVVNLPNLKTRLVLNHGKF